MEPLGLDGYAAPENCTRPWWPSPATVVNSPPKATRPLVAASGVGVARAALEFLKEKLAENGVRVRYGVPRQKLSNIEREVIDMEIMLKSAWLMVIKATWMADNKKPNALEASMSKVKSGDVTTKITQKVV